VLGPQRWRRLAAVLATATSPALTGCVIPNYEYGPARQSPVFVLDSSIAPSAVTPLLLKEQDTPVHLTLTAFAEDAGDELMSALYVDYKHQGGYYLLSHRHGTEAIEVPRPIEYDFNRGLPPEGCHALTVMLFHESEWDDANFQIVGVPPDLASVTWFVSIAADGHSAPLASCPDVSTQSPL
jgi:hypothetical protein